MYLDFDKTFHKCSILYCGGKVASVFQILLPFNNYVIKKIVHTEFSFLAENLQNLRKMRQGSVRMCVRLIIVDNQQLWKIFECTGSVKNEFVSVSRTLSYRPWTQDNVMMI